MKSGVDSGIIEEEDEKRFNPYHDPSNGRFTRGGKTTLTGKKESDIISKGRVLDLQFFSEKDISKQKSNSIKKGIQSYKLRISEHTDKINNPDKYVKNWNMISERKQQGLIKHWNKEINNFKQSIKDRIDELKKRGDYND